MKGASDAGDGKEPLEPAAPVVALVCSAGGLRAVSEILEGLPLGLGATVIVLQHQEPGRPHYLVELLSRRSPLPVVMGRSGAKLEPGFVVVVPAGQHALVTADNELALIASDGPPPYRPSADLLLVSLALVASQRSVGVVLSGEGHDGALGAAALHQLGGTVIASDRTSSEHFSMPAASIDRGAVDVVLPVAEIPERLRKLVEGILRGDGRIRVRARGDRQRPGHAG